MRESEFRFRRRRSYEAVERWIGEESPATAVSATDARRYRRRRRRRRRIVVNEWSGGEKDCFS